MCLTEPQAGSAVGALTTKAFQSKESGVFEIKGNKIFITAGDHDLVENIIHLVLARVEGDAEGSKGISLFAVPKFRLQESGALGASNNVVCTGLEHKMGIHGSPTCALAFGDDGPCYGYLIGEQSRGLSYMFQMMNEARLLTAIQGVAAANLAYQLALAYARERRQGASLKSRGQRFDPHHRASGCSSELDAVQGLWRRMSGSGDVRSLLCGPGRARRRSS